MWTVSGEGGEGVDCEWGRRGGCGLGVGKEGRVWTVSGEVGRVWTVSGEAGGCVDWEWGRRGGEGR